MINILTHLSETGGVASFLVGGAPDNPIDGIVVQVSSEKVVIETEVAGNKYRYAMHPSNVVIIERR